MLSPHSTNRQIGELRVKPKEHPSFLLGTFTEANPPTGFSIAISPDPVPADSVITRVVTSGPSEHYKLILHVTNNGTKSIGVKVHQL